MSHAILYVDFQENLSEDAKQELLSEIYLKNQKRIKGFTAQMFDDGELVEKMRKMVSEEADK